MWQYLGKGDILQKNMKGVEVDYKGLKIHLQ